MSETLAPWLKLYEFVYDLPVEEISLTRTEESGLSDAHCLFCPQGTKSISLEHFRHDTKLLERAGPASGVRQKKEISGLDVKT